MFNAYEYEIHRAIYNEDFDLLGTDNPDIIESYEIIKHFRYDEIASTGLALYNHLVKEDDNWRANRKHRYNNRLIYLSNEKTGELLFFSDVFYPDVIDFAFKHNAKTVGITSTLEYVTSLDMTDILAIGEDGFLDLGRQIDSLRERMRESTSDSAILAS